MDTTIQYQDILEQYPIYITKDQMYRVCHISKKTCLFLLESGLVPCQDSGKKTRRFKIKTTNVIRYLEDRDIPSTGKKETLVTPAGMEFGLYMQPRVSLYGREYNLVLYSRPAQEYIAAHMEAILNA